MREPTTAPPVHGERHSRARTIVEQSGGHHRWREAASGERSPSAFSTKGPRSSIFGRQRAPLDAVAELAPARVLAVAGDVTRSADLDQLVRDTNRRFGHVDVIVPAAGMAQLVPSVECSSAEVSEQFAVNFIGAIETVRLFLPSLASPAAVLFVTGSLANSGQPGFGIYNASKAAVAAFAQSLAVELAPRKVRVNCLSPGPMDTPFWGKLVASTAKLKRLQEEWAGHSLTQAPGNADDVAEAAVFLASDAAKSICGQEIICDGGYSIA